MKNRCTTHVVSLTLRLLGIATIEGGDAGGPVVIAEAECWHYPDG